MAILPTLQSPSDLRGLSEAQLDALPAEIRECIISTVARTGGHLGSSLGVVEVTLALHRVLAGGMHVGSPELRRRSIPPGSGKC